jgi:RimJ/RimL family protein N-acetyltransferase
MEELLSKRLKLRLVDIHDHKVIYAYRSQPGGNKYQLWKPASLEEVDRFITSGIVREPNIPNTWLQLAIVLLDTNDLLGDLGIHFLPIDRDQVEIGITIAPQYQRNGYATEALTLTFEYIFNRLGKHRIIASLDPENLACMQLMEKMKMRKEAHFKKSLFVDGVWNDDIIFAILEEEYR